MLGRTWSLGTYFGIPLKMHWTFGFIIFVVVYMGYSQSLSITEILLFSSIVFVLFLSVVLHEYGHALAAKKYHVRTKDIIISPIGGVARLERLPRNPAQELVIAIAGPLVNMVIATILALVLYFGFKVSFDALFDASGYMLSTVDIIQTVFLMNCVLFAFNLIPAFPMDGGRILRALLNLKLTRRRATQIAIWIGCAIALLFIYYAVMHHIWSLLAIGIFVIIMAQMEYRQVQVEEFLHETTAGQFAQKPFTIFQPTQLMSEVEHVLEQSPEQKNFLVESAEGQNLGVLHEFFIREAVRNRLLSVPVVDFISKRFSIVNPETTLIDLSNQMNHEGYSVVVVNKADGDKYVIDRGMISSISQQQSFF